MYYMKIRTNITHVKEECWLPLRKPDSSIIYFSSQKQLTTAAKHMNLSDKDYIVGEDKLKNIYSTF